MDRDIKQQYKYRCKYIKTIEIKCLIDISTWLQNLTKKTESNALLPSSNQASIPFG
jgi:hypothetical protein